MLGMVPSMSPSEEVAIDGQHHCSSGVAGRLHQSDFPNSAILGWLQIQEAMGKLNEVVWRNADLPLAWLRTTVVGTIGKSLGVLDAALRMITN
jgi:hypothetical protein